MGPKWKKNEVAKVKEETNEETHARKKEAAHPSEKCRATRHSREEIRTTRVCSRGRKNVVSHDILTRNPVELDAVSWTRPKSFYTTFTGFWSRATRNSQPPPYVAYLYTRRRGEWDRFLRFTFVIRLGILFLISNFLSASGREAPIGGF